MLLHLMLSVSGVVATPTPTASVNNATDDADIVNVAILVVILDSTFAFDAGYGVVVALTSAFATVVGVLFVIMPLLLVLPLLFGFYLCCCP